MSRPRVLLLGAIILLCSLRAEASIGLGETHDELNYGDRALLQWIHPGDGCDQGKYCFHVVKRDNKGWFAGLYDALSKVSIPRSGSALIVAQKNSDGSWIAYDLHEEKIIAEGPDPRSVGASFSLEQFASADEPSSVPFSRTWSSRFEGLAFVLILFWPVIALSLLVSVLWLFFRRKAAL